MQLAQSGLKLVTAGHDSCIRVWDLSHIGANNGKEIQTGKGELICTLENAHEKKYDEAI